MSAPTDNQAERSRAGSLRIALGIFSVCTLPLLFPSSVRFLPVFLAYLAAAVGFQLAIRRRVGGDYRVLLGGLIDIAFITFLVYRLGTASTPLVGAYLLTGMFNALVASSWAARLVSAMGLVTYGIVSYAEAIHVLPYAPEFPELAVFTPTVRSAVRDTLLLGALIAVSTFVSDRIAMVLRRREHELREMNSRLEDLSQRDPLTQLFNRRYFVQRVEEELQRVRRGRPCALVMMDLDRFKHINDKQGHLAGDELLRKIATAIQEKTRAVDVVGRYGGDEFVVLLTDTDAEQAPIVAERLVRTVRGLGSEADARRPVTASLGVAIARPEDSVNTLLSAADEAAYRAKAAGGDRFVTLVSHSLAPDSQDVGSGPRTARAG
jgi:diguanylate cyclase (GGDEF)-like protein